MVTQFPIAVAKATSEPAVIDAPHTENDRFF